MSTTSATSAGGTKVNSGKRVLCTGGDGDLLMQLLQPHHGGLIEQIESDDRDMTTGVSVDLHYEVDSSKHLIHYGIACVLSKQSKLSKQKQKELIRESLQDKLETPKLDVLNDYVGKRVAKRFNVETDDGDKIFRGNVMKVIEIPGAESEFRIKYDDGDGEDVSMKELLSE
jgi:hypothetical protein